MIMLFWIMLFACVGLGLSNLVLAFVKRRRARRVEIAKKMDSSDF